ncbi:MAG: DNA-processing protein DprA [Clostridia bacterium]|nr:DNA-processing protein DprA [Clostridia bacterium]
MDELTYLIWLHLNHAVSTACKVALLDYFGSPSAVYMAEKKDYIESGLLTNHAILSLLNKNVKSAKSEIANAFDKGISIVGYRMPGYPSALYDLHDPPIALYVMGDRTVLQHKAVFCMVGSRHASVYGMSASLGVAEQLSRCGMSIVCGFAVGIDTAAHRGAIRGGGKTIAVLGCGIDMNYPAENAKLKDSIIENGAIISEFPLGTPPYGTNFPIRNRILSGLSLGVAVMEAGERSGALITAKCALEQGKDVFALPGNISNPLSSGTNKLIQEGAALLSGADEILSEYILRYPSYFEIQDLIEEKNEEPDVPDLIADQSLSLQSAGLTEEERAVYCVLSKEKMSFEEICKKTGLSAAELNTRLTLLQIKGKLREHPGLFFSR